MLIYSKLLESPEMSLRMIEMEQIYENLTVEMLVALLRLGHLGVEKGSKLTGSSSVLKEGDN